MRKLFTTLLSLLVLLFAAQTAKATDFYGATLGSYNGHGPSLFRNADVLSYDGDFTWWAIDENDPSVLLVAGADCGGNYYGLLTKDQKAFRFVSVDWATGTITKVADLNEDYPVFDALAYNNANGKLYGAWKEADTGKSSIYEVSVTDGSYTKVKILNDEIRAMDFSYSGILHAISVGVGQSSWGDPVSIALLNTYDPYFARIDSKQVFTDYAENVTVDYGYGTNLHSLAFEHTTGTLYWTNTLGGYQQVLYTLDLETGKRIDTQMTLGRDNNYSQWYAACLYIPFNRPDGGASAAGEVTLLTATADANGALKATLSWTNPVKDFGGSSLEELYSVRIYRGEVSDENLLAEIKDVAPGQEQTWTDENASAGMNAYTLVPCRVEGEKGLSSDVSVWVSYDVPVAVRGIELETLLLGVGVKWEGVTETVHGGPLDTSTLTYKVVRMPDEVVVSESTAETEVVDNNPMPSWQNYYYTVTPSTAAGTGETAESGGRIFTGPALEDNYETSFEDYDANNMWKSEELNGDGFSGYFDSSTGMFSYLSVYYDDNAIKSHNTMLYTPNISLSPGKYLVKVGSFIAKQGMTNSFEVAYGMGSTVEAQSHPIGEASYTSTDVNQEDMAEFIFEVTEKDIYNLSIHITAPKVRDDYENALGITYFKIEPYTPPLTYDFEPASILPGNNAVLDEPLSAIEFEFPENVDKNDAVIATVKDDKGNEVTTAYPDWGISDPNDYKLVSLVLSDPLATPGTYTITVPAGIFGTEDWALSMYKNGACNPEFTLTYTISKAVGIENVEIAAPQLKVYDINGRRIQATSPEELKGLRPGVYIVNGRKVVMK